MPCLWGHGYASAKLVVSIIKNFQTLPNSLDFINLVCWSKISSLILVCSPQWQWRDDWTALEHSTESWRARQFSSVAQKSGI